MSRLPAFSVSRHLAMPLTPLMSLTTNSFTAPAAKPTVACWSCRASVGLKLNRRRSGQTVEPSGRYSSSMTSLFGKHQVHHPAPPHMRPRSGKVLKNRGVGATGFAEGVGERGHTVEGAGIVDGLRKRYHGRCPPR